MATSLQATFYLVMAEGMLFLIPMVSRDVPVAVDSVEHRATPNC